MKNCNFDHCAAIDAPPAYIAAFIAAAGLSTAKPHVVRQRLETLVEASLSILDALDGDADNEPSLGSPENHPNPRWQPPGHSPDGDQSKWAVGISDDREDDGDDREPDCDTEPGEDDEPCCDGEVDTLPTGFDQTPFMCGTNNEPLPVERYA